MSVNPRSNLTRRTPEGPMEKRSGKRCPCLLHYRIYVFPRTMLAICSSSNQMSCPLVPGCDQHRFCARHMQVAANMTRHMEWQWRVSLLIPTILVSIPSRPAHHPCGRPYPRRQRPRHFTFGCSTTQARAGSGTT
jgi:hypothetical protein